MKNWTDKLAFSRLDQDVLNATIMATNMPIAVLGPESMGMFPWTNAVMLHAMFQFRKKPWSRNYLLDAFLGFAPDRTYLAYWRFVDGLRPFNKFKLVRKKSRSKLRG